MTGSPSPIEACGTKLAAISPRVRFGIWLGLLLLMAAYGGQLWSHGAKIQSDILAMLPKLQQDPLTERALARVEGKLSDRLYLALVAKDDARAIAAAKLLQSELQSPQGASNPFSEIRSGASDSGDALSRFYFPHRFKLLTREQTQLLQSAGGEGLEQLLQQALQQTYSAFGYAGSGLLAQDPLLLYPANLQALAPRLKLGVSQGILLTHKEAHSIAIIMAKGRQSVFNPNAQQAQNAALQQALTRLQGAYPDVQVLKAGGLFHALAATQSAKAEISIIGMASLVGVILLVWLAFRSVMPLLLALLTIGSGLLFAIVSTLAVFKELHLLTLVFGTSLIGIAIDYSFHYYCERLQHQHKSAAATVRHIFPAMSLALLTSVLAYLGIGLTPFPGMQQVAIFCASGLVGAYLCLLLAYPLLAGSRLPPGDKPLAMAQRYLQSYLGLFQSGTTTPGSAAPKARRLAALLLLVLLGSGLARLASDDNIRNLQQSPAELGAEEDRLRTLLSGGTDNQFILARADSEQALLQRLEHLTPVLEQALAAGELGNFVSLSPYLPSTARQAENYALQAQIYLQHLPQIGDALGLTDALLPTLRQAYLDAAGLEIHPLDLLHGPLAQDLADLWLAPASAATGQTSEYGAIIMLGGIADLPGLTQRLAYDDKVQLVDKVAQISAVMGQYRRLTLGWLGLALLMAALIFSLRFGFKLACVVVAVPALAALLTLAALGLMGSPLSLFHALALILVFGIGVDYSLFFAENRDRGAAVMMAVFMSACSTLLAFGLLAFSQTLAIHFFGLTLSLGIACTLLLAPLIQAPLINTVTRNVNSCPN
ncbi:MMPL family transporter [Shewanella sp. AS16]|uniref:MMPL family transporter n=1 Tax=Shewanella sp. AS16 TaxID=2907625 RepID=UPI001F3C5557|nr:MMPL family transporter [Shewanella sp. AS16]MCE9687943.1 MMPL family transporter [Shewanella sp. AS16]